MNKPVNSKTITNNFSNDFEDVKNLCVPVEVYSRVSGYFRPVHQWNKGKREEFSNRKIYKISRFLNEK